MPSISILISLYGSKSSSKLENREVPISSQKYVTMHENHKICYHYKNQKARDIVGKIIKYVTMHEKKKQMLKDNFLTHKK